MSKEAQLARLQRIRALQTPKHSFLIQVTIQVWPALLQIKIPYKEVLKRLVLLFKKRHKQIAKVIICSIFLPTLTYLLW